MARERDPSTGRFKKKVTVMATPKRFQVGQVLFIIMNEKGKVLPCQVSEENERKTLQGNTISYKVVFGKQDPQVLELDKIDGEILTSADEVRKTLIERASRVINKMVDMAQKRAQEWYTNPTHSVKLDVMDVIDDQVQDENPEDPYSAIRDPDEDTVELPDGRKAKVNIKVPKDLNVPTRK